MEFDRCPNDHVLPHKMPGGECTPVRCAAIQGTGSATSARHAKARREKRAAVDQAPTASKLTAPPSAVVPPPGEAAPDAVALAKVTAALDAEDTKIALASKKHDKWMGFLKAPQGLSGDDAEKYADGKLASLLPAAVATLEKFLRFGTDDQQERAARQILEANGRGKREAIAASQPPIVIQVTGSGGVNLPWRQEKAEKAVEGEVVRPSSEKPK